MVHDERASVALASRPFVIRDATGEPVDSFRSGYVADYYCRILNEGRAVVYPHNLVGCRVVTLGYVR